MNFKRQSNNLCDNGSRVKSVEKYWRSIPYYDGNEFLMKH